MFIKAQLLTLVLSLVLFPGARGHGTITAVTGANGVNGQGFGIIDSTPRNGGLPVPFEQDTSVIRNNEIASGTTGVCGRTKAGGNNDVASQLTAASQSGLPSAAADGSVTMNLHQVNQDGAGPYTCDVSGDGGQTFQNAAVTQNVPGKASLSFAVAQDFPLVAQMPAGMQCTAGPNGDACIMRCRNSAIAGPFGSCVAVTNSGSNSTSTGTAASGTNSTGTATGATGAASGVTSSTSTTAGTGAAAGDAAAGAGTTTSDTAAKAGAGGVLGKLKGALGGAAAGAGSSAGATAAGAGTGAGAAGGALGKLKGALGGKGAANKRFVTSRVVGKRSNFWIDA